MKAKLIGITVLLALAPAWGQEEKAEKQPAPVLIELPKEYNGKPGKPLVIHAITTGKIVKWLPKDDGLQVISEEYLKDSKIFIAIADKPGRYRVLAITSIADAPVWAETSLVIGDASPPGPAPPGPGPGPGPAPVPVPVPVDDLVQRLQKAYDADPSPAAVKGGQKAALSGFYEAMQTHADAATVATLDKLLANMREVSKAMIPPSALVGVRQVLSAELAVAFGDEPGTVLTDALRIKARATFIRISKALDGVK